MDRPELLKLTHRLLDLVEAGTTEQAESEMEVPVARYADAARWQREMDEIFAKVPLLLAFGGELPEPGDYKAMDVLGTPVLLTRGADGRVRSFLNVCRHRGAIVTPEGCAHARRHTCPYHGWSYDATGALVGVPGKREFGLVDDSALGLTELPVAERAGMIFGQTTPGIDLGIDAWLGGLDDLLAPLDIGSWRLLDRRSLDGPNWKVCYDGYLEGYHFQTLHRKSLFKVVMGQVMAFDSYGPHQRVGFARHGIEALRDIPEEEWDPHQVMSVIVTFFPHSSVVISEEGGFLSQLWPGTTPDRSTTTQSTFATRLPADDAERAAAKLRADMLYAIVRDEDYATSLGIQRALSSGAAEKAGHTFLLGRNELGNQRFHCTLDTFLAPSSNK